MQEGLIGTVKAYYSNKGFGFLVQPLGQPDIFMHRYEIEGDDPEPGEVILIVLIKSCLNNSSDNAD